MADTFDTDLYWHRNDTAREIHGDRVVSEPIDLDAAEHACMDLAREAREARTAAQSLGVLTPSIVVAGEELRDLLAAACDELRAARSDLAALRAGSDERDAACAAAAKLIAALRAESDERRETTTLRVECVGLGEDAAADPIAALRRLFAPPEPAFCEARGDGAPTLTEVLAALGLVRRAAGTGHDIVGPRGRVEFHASTALDVWEWLRGIFAGRMPATPDTDPRQLPIPGAEVALPAPAAPAGGQGSLLPTGAWRAADRAYCATQAGASGHRKAGQ